MGTSLKDFSLIAPIIETKKEWTAGSPVKFSEFLKSVIANKVDKE